MYSLFRRYLVSTFHAPKLMTDGGMRQPLIVDCLTNWKVYIYKANFGIHKSLRHVRSILMNFCVTGVLHTLETIPGGGLRTTISLVCSPPVRGRLPRVGI